MKPFLALISGFVAASGLLISGAAVATLLITNEPSHDPDPGQDIAQLWSAEPRPVDQASQQFDRLPADEDTEIAEVDTGAAASSPSLDAMPPVDEIDMASTGSIDASPSVPSAQMEPISPREQVSEAHNEWCADNYLSYRPETNSYTTYDGAERICASPYQEEMTDEQDDISTATLSASTGSELPQQAMNDESFISADHVEECFSRYRSYRPEDNTYQPYGGGPRQQCL